MLVFKHQIDIILIVHITVISSVVRYTFNSNFDNREKMSLVRCNPFCKYDIVQKKQLQTLNSISNYQSRFVLLDL